MKWFDTCEDINRVTVLKLKKFVTAIVAVMVLWPGLAFAELDLKGSLFQGGMMVGKTEAGARIFLDGHEIRVGKDGRFVFGFPWDAAPTAMLKLVLPSGA